jgi:UDP-perosamine 4-acetyltransferase
VLVIGGGGHARVCLDALADTAEYSVVGCVTADGSGVDGLPVPVLGNHDQLASIASTNGATHAFVAVGDNAARRRIIGELEEIGLALATAISRFAMVSGQATIGPAVLVCAGAVVNAGASLGTGVIVNSSASVDHDCRIGDGSHIAPGAVLGGEVVIGSGVFVGLGSRVLPRVMIGDGAVVGAGAVVVRDVTAGATVVGVPARVR